MLEAARWYALLRSRIRADAGGRVLGGQDLTRRSLLGGTVLGGTLLFAVGCADPNGADEPPDAELSTLRAAVASETALIALYNAAREASPALSRRLRPPLHHHQSHLARLKSRIQEASPAPSPTRTPTPAPPKLPAGSAAVLAELRKAEHAASDRLTRQLARVSPSLAQLLASIAACEYGHLEALSD